MKRVTTAALTIISNYNGEIKLRANAKAAPGSQIIEWSIDWGDGESEDGTVPLPSTVDHSYIESGEKLVIFTVKDSKNKIVSTGLNVLIVRISTPSPNPTPPVISSLSTTSGNIGAAVTVNGSNFGSIQGTSKLYFNGIQATIDSWSATSIATHVPVGATTGQVTVVVSNETSNGIVFTVTGGEAYDYYVSTTGSDAANGLTLGTAFATIKHALEVASSALSGTGKTIAVVGGTYNQGIQNPSASGTSWTNKLRVVSYLGQTVWIRPNADPGIWFYNGQHYIEFDDINVDGTLAASHTVVNGSIGAPLPHHIRYQNLEIIGFASLNVVCIHLGAHDVQGTPGGYELLNSILHGAGAYGVYVAAPNCIVDGNEIYNCGKYGIHVYNDDPLGDPANNNQISDNYIHDLVNGAYPVGSIIAGMLIADNNNRIYNNVCVHVDRDLVTTDPHSAGIQIFSGSNNQVYFNTIYNNAVSWGVYLDGFGAPTNSVIQNNISYLNGNGDIFTGGLPGTIENHNLKSINPLFVSATDYHLQAGSPAKGFGVAITGITTDKDGNLRADPPSAGAYE